MTDATLATRKPHAEPGRLRRLFRWMAGDIRAALAILVLVPVLNCWLERSRCVI